MRRAVLEDGGEQRAVPAEQPGLGHEPAGEEEGRRGRQRVEGRGRGERERPEGGEGERPAGRVAAARAVGERADPEVADEPRDRGDERGEARGTRVGEASLLHQPRHPVLRGRAGVREQRPAQHQHGEGGLLGEQTAQLDEPGRAGLGPLPQAARCFGSAIRHARATPASPARPKGVEAGPPAERRTDPAGEREAAREAHRDPGIEDAVHEAEPLRPEAVGEHREGRRRERRLPDTDSGAPERERGEAAGGAGEAGRGAPGGETSRQQPRPAEAVGGDAHRQRGRREDDDERRADQQADLRARKAEVRDQQRRERCDHLAVHVAQHVQEGERGDEAQAAVIPRAERARFGVRARVGLIRVPEQARRIPKPRCAGTPALGPGAPARARIRMVLRATSSVRRRRPDRACAGSACRRGVPPEPSRRARSRGHGSPCARDTPG